MACGEVGLAIDYFYSLTPRQFSNILTGYRAKTDDAYKNSWYQARSIMWAALAPTQKHKITPEKIMPFPWETPEPVEFGIPNETALQNTIDVWAQIDAARNKGKTDC